MRKCRNRQTIHGREQDVVSPGTQHRFPACKHGTRYTERFHTLLLVHQWSEVTTYEVVGIKKSQSTSGVALSWGWLPVICNLDAMTAFWGWLSAVWIWISLCHLALEPKGPWPTFCQNIQFCLGLLSFISAFSLFFSWISKFPFSEL